MPILFDQNGNRLSTPDIRQKPDVMGPDDVHTTFAFDPDGNGGFTFSGTSAAAPHVAAAAALLLQESPAATPTDITQHLESTALDINTPGYDFLTGYGLVQLKPLVVPPTPQHPDIQHFTGDIYEPNDTSDTAYNFGTYQDNTIQDYQGLTIANHANGASDYDWYRWSAGSAGTFTATMSVTQGGPLLEMHLFTLQGNTLVELANTRAGAAGATLSTVVSAGQPILVEVKGVEISQGVKTQGTYELKLHLEG